MFGTRKRKAKVETGTNNIPEILKLYESEGYVIKRKMLDKEIVASLLTKTDKRMQTKKWRSIPGQNRAQSLIKRKDRQPFLKNMSPIVDYIQSLGYPIEAIATARDGGLSILRSWDKSEKQLLHCDFNENKNFFSLTMEKKFSSIPLVVVVALVDNTPFIVFPGAIARAPTSNGRCALHDPDKAITLKLNSGDVCIFRADLIHSGAAFNLKKNENNFRFHLFVSSSDDVIGNAQNAFKVAQKFRLKRPRGVQKDTPYVN
jgi:ectoine hydroxylase-related dioxygenase (phytanoyl-CoA dioxygenase family)